MKAKTGLLRRIRKIVAVCMCLLLTCGVLTSCNGNDSDESGGNTTTLRLGIFALPTHYLMQVFDDMGLYEQNGANVELVFFPGGADCIQAFTAGQLDMIAFAAPDAIPALVNGVDFKIISVYDKSYGLDGIAARSDIETVADLKGKKVCVGDQGSGSEVNASQIIAAAGMSYSDFDVQYLSFSEASTAMQNGTVDAAFATSALPNSAITELANYTDIVVVPIDGEIADNLIAQYPFYAKTTIGTDVYGVEAAETVAMMAVLTTTTDLDEEVVYNITKTLFENQTDLIAGNAHGREVTLDTALQGVTVDFHPGAVKYYKEKGIM